MEEKIKPHFEGDRKRLDHFLLAYERWLINLCMPWVPLWMSTVHLTLMTLLWSAGIVLCGWLAAYVNINWLWGFSILVFLQHVTDMLDGEVGRSRKEGLVKWGFYMDHFLDYIFICSILIGYSFFLPASYMFLTLLSLAALGGFMVHSFLDFGITNDFKISLNRFGASEGRYVVIVLNKILIIFGTTFFIKIFPWIVLILFICLFMVVYHFQKTYRHMDRTGS